MKIIQLTIENVKRVVVVQITPHGNLIAIGGKNGSGKSSVLDAVWYALGGEKVIPDNPIRRGQTKGKVELDLGDLLVKRTFTPRGGGSLTVCNKDGVPQSSPQALLDKLCTRIAFDPLEFANQKPDKQAETLKDLLGLNFKEENGKIARLTEERTAVNRELKSLQSRLVATVEYLDVTETVEKSASEIMAEQAKAADRNKGNAERRQEAHELNSEYNTMLRDQGMLLRQIEQARTALAELEKKETAVRCQAVKKRNEMEPILKSAGELKDEDLAPFQAKVSEVEQTNFKIRNNRAKKELREQARAKEKASEALTAQIEEVEGKKRNLLTDAKFPVPGLGLDDLGNVTFDGIAFAEANTASKIRVSVAIGLALNKELRVLLIRQGSELDPDSRQILAEMAEAAQAQVWLETSRTDAPVSVVMEDGHAVEPAPAAEPDQRELV